jgi:hypothetical protein
MKRLYNSASYCIKTHVVRALKVRCSFICPSLGISCLYYFGYLDMMVSTCFNYIPDICKNQRLCNFIVGRRCRNSTDHTSWGVLENIPRKYMTQEICSNVFNCYNHVLHIPFEFITEEMCDEFYRKKNYAKISMIPPKFRSKERCEKNFKEDPESIIHIPEQLATRGMWEEVLDKKCSFSCNF